MDDAVKAAPREGAPYDAELRAALNVEPSAEFVARVRTRIASEPAPSRWRLAWVMVPVATAAVLILGALVEIRPRPEPAVPVQTVTQSAPISVPPPAIAPEPALSGARLQADQRRVRLQADRLGSAAVPEVLVSADERRALEFVALIVSNGRIEDLEVEPAKTGIEAVTLRDVDIVPITGLGQVRIEPLQIARLEGEPQ
jgi:hypothetical protein